MRGYGPQWTIGLNTNLLPFAAPGNCDVVMVMTNAHVSEVGYAAVDGSALPLRPGMPASRSSGASKAP